MKLRPATLADVDLLRHWDEHPHVRASDPNDGWAWEVELEKALIGGNSWSRNSMADRSDSSKSSIQRWRRETIGAMSRRIFERSIFGLGKQAI